jgi:hypothetical protein
MLTPSKGITMNCRLALCAVVSLAFCGFYVSADDKGKPAASNSAKAQFEQLKKLVGDWAGKASHEGGELFDATVSYKVTSAGSTVMETLFGGTDHEMITMYHLHGDAVVLTHYCSLGNQPRMKLQPSDNPKKLVFKFLDGTNLDPAKDMHMHEATIELIGDDQIKSAWTMFNNGKAAEKANFDLKRKK